MTCKFPSLAAAAVLSTALAHAGAGPESALSLFDFGSGDSSWGSIDDRVMGGISQSRMSINEGVARFEGVVSLENNGGFASVRSPAERRDLSAFDGLVLRVRGDGNTYGVRLRTTAAFDGVSYQADIAPRAGEWIEVMLPFDAFRAVFRGRPVPGHSPLDPRRIQTVGFIIARKQAGPFLLETAWIRAYRNTNSE